MFWQWLAYEGSLEGSRHFDPMIWSPVCACAQPPFCKCITLLSLLNIVTYCTMEVLSVSYFEWHRQPKWSSLDPFLSSQALQIPQPWNVHTVFGRPNSRGLVRPTFWSVKLVRSQPFSLWVFQFHWIKGLFSHHGTNCSTHLLKFPFLLQVHWDFIFFIQYLFSSLSRLLIYFTCDYQIHNIQLWTLFDIFVYLLCAY